MKLHKILYASKSALKKKKSLFSLAKEAIPEKCTLLSSSKVICFSRRTDLFVLYQGLWALVTGLDFFVHFLCPLLVLVPAFSSGSSGTVFFFIVESTLIEIHCSLR